MTNRDRLTNEILQYASQLEEQDALLHAPARTKSEILEKSRRLDVQLIVHTNIAAKKFEFFLYTLRVGFAVTFALFMLVSVSRFSIQTTGFLVRDSSISSTLQYQTQRVNTYLSQISESIFALETEDILK